MARHGTKDQNPPTTSPGEQLLRLLRAHRRPRPPQPRRPDPRRRPGPQHPHGRRVRRVRRDLLQRPTPQLGAMCPRHMLRVVVHCRRDGPPFQQSVGPLHQRRSRGHPPRLPRRLGVFQETRRPRRCRRLHRPGPRGEGAAAQQGSPGDHQACRRLARAMGWLRHQHGRPDPDGCHRRHRRLPSV